MLLILSLDIFSAVSVHTQVFEVQINTKQSLLSLSNTLRSFTHREILLNRWSTTPFVLPTHRWAMSIVLVNVPHTCIFEGLLSAAAIQMTVHIDTTISRIVSVREDTHATGVVIFLPFRIVTGRYTPKILKSPIEHWLATFCRYLRMFSWNKTAHHWI